MVEDARRNRIRKKLNMNCTVNYAYFKNPKTILLYQVILTFNLYKQVFFSI